MDREITRVTRCRFKKILDAIEFAKKNENSVDRDLRISILRSFGHEPDTESKDQQKKGRNKWSNY